MSEEIKLSIISWIDLLYIQIQKNAEDLKIEFESEANQYRVNIINPLVKKITHDNLDYILSLQHVIRTLVHKEFPNDRTHFLFDINFIRRNKELELQKAVPNLVNDEVLQKGNSIIFTNLNGYERLLIRNLLDGIKEIEAKSVGKEPDRKLVILPSSNTGTSGLDNSLVFDSEIMKILNV